MVQSEGDVVTKKAKITFTCSDEVKEYLSSWADDENRTVSNLIETIVEKTIEERESSLSTKNMSTKDKGDK